MPALRPRATSTASQHPNQRDQWSPAQGLPALWEPALAEARFCTRCASSLRSPCAACQQEIPIWADFCPFCRHPQHLMGAKAANTSVPAAILPPLAPTGEAAGKPTGAFPALVVPQDGGRPRRLGTLHAKILAAVLVTAVVAAGGVTALFLVNGPLKGTSASASSRSSLFNSPAAADISSGGSSLHVQSSGFDCYTWITLNGVRASYDQSAIQQIDNYVAAVYDRDGGAKTGVTQLPLLPDTLQALPGSAVCNATFDITNSGIQNIPIINIAAKLTRTPMKNTLNYRLLDMCSLPIRNRFSACNPCQSGCGGGLPDCSYSETFQLKEDAVNADLAPPIDIQPDYNGSVANCPSPIILAPGKLLEISLVVRGADFIYQGVQFSLIVQSDSGGNATLTLPPAFTSTMTFLGNSDSFSCFALKNNAFIQETTSTGPSTPSLCL